MQSFRAIFKSEKILKEKLNKFNFDEEAKNDFLKGAKLLMKEL